MSDKERFYYDGIYYNYLAEVHQAAMQNANSKVSPITAKRILYDMVDAIVLNMFNPHPEEKMISNSELRKLSEECLIEFIGRFREEVGKEE